MNATVTQTNHFTTKKVITLIAAAAMALALSVGALAPSQAHAATSGTHNSATITVSTKQSITTPTITLKQTDAQVIYKSLCSNKTKTKGVKGVWRVSVNGSTQTFSGSTCKVKLNKGCTNYVRVSYDSNGTWFKEQSACPWSYYNTGKYSSKHSWRVSSTWNVRSYY